MGSEPVDSTDHREIAATIHEQRLQLFKASAVLAVCRHACVSRYEELDADEFANTLLVVDDLIDRVATVLERFAGDDTEQRRDGHDP
jgi:hypothetical protein